MDKQSVNVITAAPAWQRALNTLFVEALCVVPAEDETTGEILMTVVRASCDSFADAFIVYQLVNEKQIVLGRFTFRDDADGYLDEYSIYLEGVVRYGEKTYRLMDLIDVESQIVLLAAQKRLGMFDSEDCETPEIQSLDAIAASISRAVCDKRICTPAQWDVVQSIAVLGSFVNQARWERWIQNRLPNITAVEGF
ncbi:hypothetical protein [Pectobacterium brasiliense]|uniref:hypothetical protein n=1 Tax=Pectobacterium brasiliense TaxID=180957 RepID=UPI001968AB71|nr:hypothetical protein [Pectobacterium brasiliense]MBN3262984.1 hypothetical protein [Pectobacterium brasiliense]